MPWKRLDLLAAIMAVAVLTPGCGGQGGGFADGFLEQSPEDDPGDDGTNDGDGSPGGNPWADCVVTHSVWELAKESGASYVEVVTYDSQGRHKRTELDTGKDGVDVITTSHYSQEGLLTALRTDNDADGEVDQEQTYTYDSQGNELTVLITEAGAATWEATTDRDELGRATLQSEDDDVDGVIDRTRGWGYPGDSHEEDQTFGDHNADGQLDIITYYGFDETGALVHEDVDEQADGSIDWSRDYEYKAGCDIRTELDSDNDGSPNVVVVTQCDLFSSSIYRADDNEADGIFDDFMAWANEYDSQDRMVRRDEDEDANGEFGGWQTWQYSCPD